MRRSVPSTAIVPPSIGSAPAIARASSVRPLPTRPARPTISPARICSEMSLSTPLRCRPDTSRTTGAVECCGFSKCSASAAAPNIPATRLSSVSCAGRRRPDEAPAAQHRHRVGEVEHLVEEVAHVDDRPARARAGRGSSGAASRSRRWSATRSARPSRSPARRTRPRAGSRPSACRRCATRRPWRSPSSSKPHWATSSSYCARIRRHCTSPARRGSMPKKTFSITLMCGTGESSCEIVAIPSMRASRGLA